MKIGAQTSLFACYKEERYQKMKAFGFDHADLSINGELQGKTEQEYEQMILHEKELADAAGVTIWQVHGPWRYPPHDETEELRAERAEVMKRSIRCAAAIGCKYWVIHPVMPFGPSDDFDFPQFWQINLDFFRALLPYAKEHDVTICFENMPMHKLSIAPPDKTLAFIREINDPNFGLCLDTGHCSALGISPADAVRLAGKDLKVMHVHDNMGKNDEHLAPYMGVIDWADFAKALREVGFDGVFSLEVKVTALLPNAPVDLQKKMLKAITDEVLSN